MIPNTSFNVASVQLSRLPINLCQIEGYFRASTTAAWLQVHDSAITPAPYAVPAYELELNGTSPFAETLQVSNLHLREGCFVGVSSVEGTWTASPDTVDITIWTDTNVISASVVGDKSTTANTLQVWAQAANANNHLLYGLVITELLGATPWVFVFADDATIGVPLLGVQLKANSANYFYFGLAGFTPRTQIAGVVTTGCTVVVSANYPASGVAPVPTPNAAYILAITN